MTEFQKDLCKYDLIVFCEKNKVISSLQFGFQQKYSNTHALIHLTDKVRQQIDKVNYTCGIFVDFQKIFDPVDHHIILKKLEYYGVSGISNKCFECYVSSRKHFVSLKGFNSHLPDVKCGVPLLFLICIYDLFCAYSEVHHFADINLLNFTNYVKSIDKQIQL